MVQTQAVFAAAVLSLLGDLASSSLESDSGVPCFKTRFNQSGCCCCEGQCIYSGCPPCPCPQPPPGQPKPKCGLQSLADAFVSKYTATIDLLPSATSYPSKTSLDAGTNTYIWQTSPGWTSGFFPGILWQLYAATATASTATHAKFGVAAANWTVGRKGEATDNSTHDVGFMLFGSFGVGVELGPSDGGQRDTEYKSILIQGAHSLAERYNPVVGMTRSWGKNSDDDSFEVIIDNLMNLELLFWAAKHGGPTEAKLYTIAASHANKTAAFWIRDDGSTPHLCIFDPKTGALKTPCTGTPQGYSASSTWARGQAWAIYGFTMAFRYTQDPAHLENAKKVSAFWLDNPSPDAITKWDFAAPGPTFKDTSAAAIVASAFLELTGYTKDPAYTTHAAAILDALSGGAYLGGRATPAATQGNGHDCGTANCTVIETDYYTLEALRRFNAL